MRYEQTRKTAAEWKTIEDDLHDQLAEDVDAILNARYGITPEDAVYGRVKEDFIQNLVNRSQDYARVRRKRMWGEETRHGSHVRIKKLRQGERHYDHGETVIRWYVCDAPVGWMNDLEREADVRFDSDEYYSSDYRWNRDIRDYIMESVADMVFVQHGYRPYATDTGVAHSPSGRWFSNVMVRQVGTRVLVTHTAQIDV